MLPQIPSWDSLHPLIIHFPIALLLVAPVLIILGILLRQQSRGLMIAALLMMILGTVATYFAVATGEAAGELAERTSGVAAVLERHEELAQTTRVIFTALTIVFAVLLFTPSFLKRTLSRKTLALASLGFMVFYAVGAIFLVNVAHQGGRLVHEYGVRAMMASSAPSAPLNSSDGRQLEDKHENER